MNDYDAIAERLEDEQAKEELNEDVIGTLQTMLLHESWDDWLRDDFKSVMQREYGICVDDIANLSDAWLQFSFFNNYLEYGGEFIVVGSEAAIMYSDRHLEVMANQLGMIREHLGEWTDLEN